MGPTPRDILQRLAFVLGGAKEAVVCSLFEQLVVGILRPRLPSCSLACGEVRQHDDIKWRRACPDGFVGGRGRRL